MVGMQSDQTSRRGLLQRQRFPKMAARQGVNRRAIYNEPLRKPPHRHYRRQHIALEAFASTRKPSSARRRVVGSPTAGRLPIAWLPSW